MRYTFRSFLYRPVQNSDVKCLNYRFPRVTPVACFRYKFQLVSFFVVYVSIVTGLSTYFSFGALYLCVEKLVVPVGNQMERSFSLEIFREKGMP